MCGRLSGRLTKWLVKAGVISEEDYEIYEYGIRLAVMMSVNIAIMLIIGIAFKMLIESVLLLLFFGILRRYAGGYHASTPLRCFALSAVMIALGLIISNYLDGQWLIDIVIMVVLGIIVLIYAPIPDDNKPLKDGEIKRYGELAVFVYLMETCILILSAVFQMRLLVRTMASAGVLLILVLVAGIIKNGRRKKSI